MARLLTRLLVILVPIVALYGLGTMVFNWNDQANVITGMMLFCMSGLLWIASRASKRGHTILAFSFICLSIPTILSAGAAIAGGALGSRLLYYNALIIFGCGWFLGPRAMIVLTTYVMVLLIGSPLYVPDIDPILLLRTAVIFNFMVWVVMLMMGLYQSRLDKLRLALEREQDLRYQRIIEQIRDLIIVTDLDGKILSINDQSQRFCGLPADAMIGRDAREILYVDDRPAYTSGLRHLFSDSATPTFEVRTLPLNAPPGTPPTWIEVTASLVLDDADRPGGLIFVARDITRRREVEDALRVSEERYRLVSETISDYVGTVIADETDILKWEWVTDSLQRVTGFPPEEMQNKPRSFWYHPEDYPRLVADWERVRKGETVEGEYRVPLKSGGYKWLRITRRPTITHEGLMRVYVMGRDISEQKAAEAKMVELVRETERFQTINHFVRAISHDFRTALSVIETNNYLLDRTVKVNLDAELQSRMDVRLRAIREAVHHMVSQLDNMRMVAASASASSQFVDLSTLVHQIVDYARPLYESHALRLVFEGTTEPTQIRAGESEITRAINHVLENALTLTPPGGVITLHTDRVGDRVRLLISDTGPGIAAEHLPFLFDPFYRVDPARTTSEGGIGFGLTIAKLLTEMYQGTITVESQVGVGSCFTLSFPAVPQPAAEPNP